MIQRQENTKKSFFDEIMVGNGDGEQLDVRVPIRNGNRRQKNPRPGSRGNHVPPGKSIQSSLKKL